jgi:hypothetical protein
MAYWDGDVVEGQEMGLRDWGVCRWVLGYSTGVRGHWYTSGKSCDWIEAWSPIVELRNGNPLGCSSLAMTFASHHTSSSLNQSTCSIVQGHCTFCCHILSSLDSFDVDDPASVSLNGMAKSAQGVDALADWSSSFFYFFIAAVCRRVRATVETF